MTPHVAAKLRLHDEDLAQAPSRRRRVAGGGRPLIALPGPFELPEADERTLPSPLRREAIYRRLLGAADALAATLALLLVLVLLGDDRLGVAAFAAGPLVIVLFKVAGLYDRDQMRIVHSTLDEAPLLLQLTGLYAMSVKILEPVLLTGTLGRDQMAALWLAGFVAVMTGRLAARSLAGRISPPERCLVIGDPRRADRIREKLATSHAHAAVIATLSLTDEEFAALTTPESVRRLVAELDLHRIIVAPAMAETRGVVDLVRMAKATGARVSVLPRMLEVVGSSVEFEDIDGLTMLGVRPFGLSRSSHLLKRAFDLVLTSIGLLAAGPLMAAIALAIRIESKGPIFFRQVRVGRDGREFRIFKFRSMVVDAEHQKDRLRVLNEVGDGMFKISDDPRVTRVGGFLRKTSLDELPQLFNVFLGDMSLVGPRPLVTDEDAQVLGLDRSRLHLTPGMTGPWQVLGARVPMQEMVGIDYLYVAGWSLWLDLKLLVRTVRHVVRRGNV
jgi:exopolysaccharide biosynthesis polyprenyl glycosylphosphotransferase